ncbi:MAG: DNA cytosine methyltransferase [Bryobacterales bacterium]|nr:DNA cytosine methyltransferase [Bryobacterales bacterium]
MELFAGAGGLALGIESAGFRHHTVIERDRYCCDTVRENKARGFTAVQGWNLYPGDVRKFDYNEISEPIDLLAGGPPCQPFSIGGKHRGFNDHRDMFPEVVRAVRALRPRAILVENVKGLTRRTFANYFSYITLQLTHPEVERKADETWEEHRDRLEKHHTGGTQDGLRYKVVTRLLNAANFGVPQKRERVFFVGIRSDQNIAWTFPEHTHSFETLLHDQWVSGEYWERHKVSKRKRPELPLRWKTRVERMRFEQPLFRGGEAAWRTVRDTIADLPDPEYGGDPAIANHLYNPGARPYPGHTGSPLDEPAKTLKAGDHGVPGGENMLLKPDGSVRYFTDREAPRLQTFPDDYIFHGAWGETMRQLGNAVPVTLGASVANSIAENLGSVLRMGA